MTTSAIQFGGLELALTADIHGHEEAFLALEALASAPFSEFAFENDADARGYQATLFAGGVAEYAPPVGRLLLADGRPAGMFAVLDAPTLRQRRLRTALLLGRHAPFSGDAAVPERLQLLAKTLYQLGPSEAYISRIAVASALARRGLGRWLVDAAIEEARGLGASSLVLDVAEGNDTAIRLYERSGFSRIGQSTAVHPSSGRTLTTLHLSRAL
jgi:ribosomal protein S18 acetylase RimI-like enzyme